MKKKIIPIAIVALVAIGIALKLTLFSTPFMYTGSIEATKIDLSSRLSSVLSELSVKEGDAVKKGQKLATLDCDDVRVLKNASESDWDRARKLVSSGAMSREAYDHAKNKYDESLVRYHWCEISSPISGRVLTSYHDVGEWVSPGVKLLTLADLEHLWAMIYVPATVLGKIKVGDELSAFLPELQNDSIRVRILKMNDEAEFTPKNVQTQSERTRLVYGIKVELPSDARIKPGMTVDVRIVE